MNFSRSDGADFSERLADLGLPQPLSNETLSSWLYRVNMRLGNPIIFDPKSDTTYHPFSSESKKTLKFVDPDLPGENIYVPHFVKRLNLPQEWLERNFPRIDGPCVPPQFRRSFCVRCFLQSIKITGQPTCNRNWMHLQKPQCETHGIPLTDSRFNVATVQDFSIRTLFYYCNTPSMEREHELINDSFKGRSALALSVQLEIDSLAKKSKCSGCEFNIRMFVLTLMRAVMMPVLHFSYPKLAFIEQKIHRRNRIVGVYGYFYQNIYQSSSLMRVHALFLCGLILGWIEEDEARQTLHEGWYSPSSAEHIWSEIRSDRELIALTVSELKRYESPFLNLSHLRGL